MIRKWEIDNKDVQQKCINEVIARVQDIDDPQQTGVIAAQDIIDIVLENAGPAMYDKAVNDAAKLVQEKLQEVEYSLEELKQT